MGCSRLMGSLHNTFSTRLVHEYTSCHSEEAGLPNNLRFFASTMFRFRKTACRYHKLSCIKPLGGGLRRRVSLPSRPSLFQGEAVIFRSAKPSFLTFLRLLRAYRPPNNNRNPLLKGGGALVRPDSSCYIYPRHCLVWRGSHDCFITEP